MATTAKWRVFRYGQKRGLCPLAIRAILRTMGCPPTLAEVPAQRFHFIKMGGSFPDGKRSFRDPDDLREISPLAEESAKKIIDLVSTYHEMRRLGLEYPLQQYQVESVLTENACDYCRNGINVGYSHPECFTLRLVPLSKRRY